MNEPNDSTPRDPVAPDETDNAEYLDGQLRALSEKLRAAGLLLVAPGVVPVAEWRPAHAGKPAQSADVYAGLAQTRRPR